MIKFEWDATKTASNKKKHDVSFEEARSVFYSEFAVPHRKIGSWCLALVMKYAPWLSAIAGMTESNTIRIISARKATKNESTFYRGVKSWKPNATKLKKSVTMRLSEDVIGYFKEMAEEKGVPYQSLINLYLRDCISSHRKIDMALDYQS